MKLSQKRKCDSIKESKDCKALSVGIAGKPSCELGYKISYKEINGYPRTGYYYKKVKPLEPCLKPMTYKELIEAREIIKKQGRLNGGLEIGIYKRI